MTVIFWIFFTVVETVDWYGRQWGGGWQWQGGSGTNRKRRSRRVEWYVLQRGSGSIDRVAIDFNSE
jgi:hypothetical protein